MSDRITDAYIDRFIDRIRGRLEDLDAELQGIAAGSQRNYRGNMQPGQIVQGYKPTTVLGAEYQRVAGDAQARAYHDIERMFDELDSRSASGRAEAASADDVATVTLALSLDPDEATLRDLYEVHGHNSTLRKAIRTAASKAKVQLPMNAADAVADNRKDARSYALALVSNRWTPGGYAEISVMPSARIDAQAIAQKLLGVDMFGRQV